MRVHLCICSRLPTLETRSELLIVRHAKERWRATNTGRIAALCLPNATIVDYGVEGQPFEPLPLAKDAVLLWPDATTPPPESAPEQIVIVDGSWPQARHMLYRVPGLSTLRRVGLRAPAEPLARLRRPPKTEHMSTLEAISEIVGLYEGDASRARLREVHDAVVAASLSARGLRAL